MLLVSRASYRAERDLLRRQLRDARAKLREIEDWRVALIAALPIAAALAGPAIPTAANARSSL